MLEEQFKGYQLKGFTFQAHLDFSDDVFQKIGVFKCHMRGKLQWLLSVSFSDEWPLFLYPLTFSARLSSLHRPLLQRIFPSIPRWVTGWMCHRLGLGYSLLVASQMVCKALTPAVGCCDSPALGSAAGSFLSSPSWKPSRSECGARRSRAAR